MPSTTPSAHPPSKALHQAQDSTVMPVDEQGLVTLKFPAAVLREILDLAEELDIDEPSITLRYAISVTRYIHKELKDNKADFFIERDGKSYKVDWTDPRDFRKQVKIKQ
jgi:hypothetical protein